MGNLQVVSQEAPEGASPKNDKMPLTSTAINANNSIENSNLTFRVMKPSTTTVNDLTLHVDPAANPLKIGVAALRRDKDAEIQQTAHRKTLLSRITASMPSGTLTAITGASGSGKTFCYPQLRIPRSQC